MAVVAKKLRHGDHIAVIAPSRSMSIIRADSEKIAISALKRLGLEVEYGKYTKESDEFASSSIKSRVEDLNWAFNNRRIKGILAVIGGFNSNQLLKYLDYKLIKENPKIFCGYSDITALSNAIYAKTGLITYSGPHFSTFGMKLGSEFTAEYFQKCLMSSKPFEVKAAKEWSDDPWYRDQYDRKFIKNDGYTVINQGEAEGTIIGGNLCTLNLLQGTQYMPSIKNSILFLEDDEETHPPTFDRDLQSLIHQPNFEMVKGLVIGRFQKASGMTTQLLKKIIETKEELKGIPVISGADFGHTTPQITFPIGGTAKITATKNSVHMKITNH
jgi:muramoyltetrapeptide carboxypeptidase LdcA involved in peptidoglycan recycling